MFLSTKIKLCRALALKFSRRNVDSSDHKSTFTRRRRDSVDGPLTSCFLLLPRMTTTTMVMELLILHREVEMLAVCLMEVPYSIVPLNYQIATRGRSDSVNLTTTSVYQRDKIRRLFYG